MRVVRAAKTNTLSERIFVDSVTDRFVVVLVLNSFSRYFHMLEQKLICALMTPTTSYFLFATLVLSNISHDSSSS